MATQVGGLIQDQNLNVHYNGASVGGKTNISKAQKKGGLGGRKPLSELSNSAKPSANQASKKVQTGGRRPLGDISNSRKPCQHQVSKKNYSKNLNGVVEEEELIPGSTIAEEQFLHNHQECIKEQRKAVDMDYFLKTIGLDNAPLPLLPVSRKLKPESPLRYLELKEMDEFLIEDRSPQRRKTELLDEHKSPPPCRTPKSPNLYMHHYNYPDFKLIETP